jgi:putative peptidoglycan lipid II flippase
MHAVMVAAGIFISRILGVLREALKARYLGATGGIAADAFNAAFRIPNILNNMFGEGVLSASFIPVYSKLLKQDDPEEADRVAGAVGTFLAFASAVLVLLGILFAPVLVDLIAAGFEGERRALTIRLTRILFPGAALLVFGAWCIGILNSHRKFFLSYAANGVWNAVLIVALIFFRHDAAEQLAFKLAWASVIGTAVMLMVQLPTVLRVAPKLRMAFARNNASVRTVLRNFVPTFAGRGVVQINSYVDQYIGSFLGIGAVTLLFAAQTLTLLPISLFGMAVSASELPELSSATGTTEEMAAHLRGRMDASLRRIAFFVVPSAAAFLVLGDVIVAALFQGGRFTAQDTQLLWAIVAAASVGLLASTLGRMYSAGFYALQDTRTPLWIAMIRVALASVVGYFVATRVPAALGLAPQWGAAALSLSSGTIGWVEFVLLRRRLNARIGATGIRLRFIAALWGAALASAALAFGLKVLMSGLHRYVIAVLVLGLYGVGYFAITRAAGIPESAEIVRRLRRLGGMEGGGQAARG